MKNQSLLIKLQSSYDATENKSKGIITMKLKLLLIPALTSLFLSGCSPEVGSDNWCADMKETPKGEWTANEAGAYTKHCIFNQKTP